MSTSINNTMETFGQDYNSDGALYQQQIQAIGSEAFDKAVATMNQYEEIKKQQLILLNNFNIETEGGNNITEKYQLLTNTYNIQFTNFEATQDFIRGQIMDNLQDENLLDNEKQEVQDMLKYLDEDMPEFEELLINKYEQKTQDIINLDFLPTGIFISAHKNFKNQIENFDNKKELDDWWDGYTSVYQTAINSLENMLQIAQASKIGSQTHAASNTIAEYQSAISSSATSISRKAQTKRAQLCSMESGNYAFLIILFVILLAMLGVGIWCLKRK